MPTSSIDLVAAPQPPLGDGGAEQRPADSPSAESLAHEQVADPALEGGVVQAPPEAEGDEPGRLAVGDRKERRGVDVVDERVESGAKRLGVAVGQAVQLAGQGKRVIEVVAAERPELDAGRTRHGEPADRAVGVAEVHRPLEVRLALLQEGGHALLLVVRGEEQVEEAALVGERIGQAHLVRGIDRLLRQAQRDRRLRGDLGRQRQRVLDDQLVLGDPGDQARRAPPRAAVIGSPVRIMLHRPALADGARQALRPAGARG